MKNSFCRTIYFSHNLKRLTAFLALVLSLFLGNAQAQVFWTEDFGLAPTCSGPGGQGTLAGSYSGINGNWTLFSTGVNDTESNKWFVSSTEAGMGLGNCSDGCGNTPALTNRTLHIGADDGVTTTDPGASYNAGGLCGLFFCVTTNMRAESPVINCTGMSNISLKFNYIENGDAAFDYADLMYFDGTSWSLLVKPPQTPSGACSPQGMWTSYLITLPASSFNNPNVKIGFNWTNNDDGVGGDPSFAVDDITLFSPLDSITTDSIPNPSPYCACSKLDIPFTSTGTFNAGNIYTAQLSDASGSFAAPVNIGTKLSTANIDTIAGIIPCNTIAGTQYRIRVISSTPGITGTDNGMDLIINANIDVTVDSATICVGQTALLTASGGTSYIWSVGATSMGDSTAQATPPTTTTYTVTGTTGSCSDTAIANVTVVTDLIIIVNSPTICTGQTANIIANGASSYTWSSGVTSTGTNTAQASPTTTTTYSVTGTSGTCTGDTTFTVTVDTALTITVNSPTICAGQVANLIANGGTTYTWSAGATSTGANTATASPSVTTNYTVTGTTSGCSGTAVSTVTVNPAPDVTVNSATICQGETANLTANGATTYTWSAGATATGTNTANATPPTTTTYTVTGTTGTCSDSAVSTVTVNSTLTISVTSPSVCPNQPATITASSPMQGTTYSWSSGATSTGGDGSTAQTQPITGTTIFIVTGTSGTSGTCTDSALSTVTITNVTVTISGNTVINSCESAELSAFPSDGSYSWGPDVTCSTCQSVTVSPSSTQQYWVTYTSPDNCTDSDTTTVVVTDIYSYFMPTGFSPNGDGLNDLIQVHGRGIASIHLRIFDRIGEKVFETKDIEKGWDGKLHGLPMNDNVFVYMLTVTYCNDETVKEKGNLTLVK